MKEYKPITHIAFYLLISLNILVLIFVLKKGDPEELSGYNSDDSVRSLISSRNYEYLTEGSNINIGPQTDSLHFLGLNYGHLIILRISESHCDICVLEAITDFRKFLKDNSSFKGIIITSIGNNDEFEAFKLRNNYITIFNVDHLGINEDEINNPYFFLIDHQLRAKMAMVHQKEFQEKTGNYFNAIKLFLTSQ